VLLEELDATERDVTDPEMELGAPDPPEVEETAMGWPYISTLETAVNPDALGVLATFSEDEAPDPPKTTVSLPTRLETGPATCALTPGPATVGCPMEPVKAAALAAKASKVLPVAWALMEPTIPAVQ